MEYFISSLHLLDSYESDIEEYFPAIKTGTFTSVAGQQSQIAMTGNTTAVEASMRLREDLQEYAMLYRYLFPTLLIALIIFGCAEQQGQYIRDGKEYGTTSGSFQGHWWNYYERGKSFSDGKFYTEAIADLKKAIKSRD